MKKIPEHNHTIRLGLGDVVSDSNEHVEAIEEDRIVVWCLTVIGSA